MRGPWSAASRGFVGVGFHSPHCSIVSQRRGLGTLSYRPEKNTAVHRRGGGGEEEQRASDALEERTRTVREQHETMNRTFALTGAHRCLLSDMGGHSRDDGVLSSNPSQIHCLQSVLPSGRKVSGKTKKAKGESVKRRRINRSFCFVKEKLALSRGCGCGGCGCVDRGQRLTSRCSLASFLILCQRKRKRTHSHTHSHKEERRKVFHFSVVSV